MPRAPAPRHPTAPRSLNTVDWGLSHGKPVVVVTPPYVSKKHELQQASLATVLRQRFGGDRRFFYENEGESIDLRNRTYSFDGVHLTAAGTERMASNLVNVLLRATEQP